MNGWIVDETIAENPGFGKVLTLREGDGGILFGVLRDVRYSKKGSLIFL